MSRVGPTRLAFASTILTKTMTPSQNLPVDRSPNRGGVKQPFDHREAAMEFLFDVYWQALGLLYIIVTFLVPLALMAFLIGAVVYVLAGPELRSRMIGWAPGVKYGVKETLGLARALRDRSPGEDE